MAKYQWTAASETVGSPPAGLTNAYTADGQSLSDWEIVADASAYGGKALKMVSGTSLRRRLTLPGVSADETVRIDMRGRVYQPEDSAATIHFVSLLIGGTGASDMLSYYAIITSGGQLQINSYQPAMSTHAQTAIPSGSRVGWWNFRFTYDPPSASPRFRLAFWADGGSGSDSSPDYELTVASRVLSVDGDLVGLGAFSANNSLVDWITVGTGADDADAAPAEEAIELSGAATAAVTASAELTAATQTHELAGDAVAQVSASGDLVVGEELVLVHDIDAGNADPETSSIADPFDAQPTVTANWRSGAGAWRHFLFALDGATGKRPFFDVQANGRAIGTLKTTWRPVWTADFETWHQAPSRTLSSDRWLWQFAEDFDADRVYVASFPIGQQLHATALAAELLEDYPSVVAPAASADSGGVYNTTPAETDDLGRAVGANPQYSLKLSWPGPTTDGLRKRRLVMFAGIHAQGENQSWFGFRAAVRWMLDSTSDAAVAFRANWDVWLYFNVNPNGLKGGNTRTTFRSTVDPNRDWKLTGSSALAEIQALRTAVESDLSGSADALYSWHGANARDTLCNLFLRTIDYNSGTRRPAYAEFVERAEVIFGVTPSLIESTYTTTDGWWGENKLGAAISFPVEMQGLGETSLSSAEGVGVAWMETLQAVDAAGLILQPADLSANASASVTAVADLSTEIPLGGAAILTGTAAGSLTTAVQLAAQALAGGQAVGSLSTAIQLDGASVAASLAAGELTAQIRFSGAAIASALAAAGLTTGDSMEGSALVSGLASGSLTTLIVLQGAAVGSVLAAADLSTVSSGLQGAATAGAAAAGALTTAIPLLGGAQVSVIAAGSVQTTVSLAGAAVAVVAVSGDLVVALELSADAVAAAVAGADLTTQIVMRADAVVGAQAGGTLAGVVYIASTRRTYVAPRRVRRAIAGMR